MATEYDTIEESGTKTLYINVVLVGDRGCGKKTIIQAFSRLVLSYRNEIDDEVVATLPFEQYEMEFHIKSTNGYLSDGDKCKQVYAQADVIVVCFSATERGALKKIENIYFQEITSYGPRKAPIVLVRNKTDLYKPNAGMVSHHAGGVFAWKYILYNCKCIDVSALHNSNVKRIFEAVADAYWKATQNKKKCTVQ